MQVDDPNEVPLALIEQLIFMDCEYRENFGTNKNNKET